MAVVLPDRALTVSMRSHEWVTDERGVPMPTPQDTLTVRGPFPGAAARANGNTWDLRVDPACWPMRAGDRITDGTLTWVVDVDPILHAVPGAPHVDHIAVTATLDPPAVL